MEMAKRKHQYDAALLAELIASGKTHKQIGCILGLPEKYIWRACKRQDIQSQRRGPRSAEGHPNWNGGKHLDDDGYVLVYLPTHPYARSPRRKYVLEHRLVMEKHLGRYLAPCEVVHHKDGDKQNNSLDNLELYPSNGCHLAEELKGRVPKWTDAGKEAIRLGVQKRADKWRGQKIQRKKAPDAPQTPQTTPLCGE
jgi:hypothetical protein